VTLICLTAVSQPALAGGDSWHFTVKKITSAEKGLDIIELAPIGPFEDLDPQLLKTCTTISVQSRYSKFKLRWHGWDPNRITRARHVEATDFLRAAEKSGNRFNLAR
jgi:hypothetical protein